ncbi:phenylalanine--tRNA ligase subunit alpha [Candidatus Saccharibacteria bacterium]|nr:phenylalanine--tRNA ligase subunit alpha [Candidatus Saccharibacteria bacterium]
MSKQLADLKLALKSLGKEYAKLKTLPAAEKKSFGEKLNAKKSALLEEIRRETERAVSENLEPLDLSAPFAENAEKPTFPRGTIHPLSAELDLVAEIWKDMGFSVIESVQLDDEFNMFDALNFPQNHPARDSYDTFRTEEGFIPPAHTSTMQYRALTRFRPDLEEKGEIAVVIPGRVFRNEDLDATHEHTFYQCEGIFVSKTANLGQLLAVWKNFFETYYGQELNIKTQPGFFPFTEPSLEFQIEKPASLGGKGDGWLEMGGCGMIHPNVLKTAGIDPEVYRGFAWGGGIDRLVMLKYGINDVRYFESGKLDFLKEF